MQLWQGNIFTGVCQSFCSQGMCVCVSQHALGQTPPGQTPPLGRHPPPLCRHPPGQTPPLGRQPPGRHPPRQTPPRQTHTPAGQTLLADTPPCPVHAGIPPPPHQQPLLQMVRILLECILVKNCFPQGNKNP